MSSRLSIFMLLAVASLLIFPFLTQTVLAKWYPISHPSLSLILSESNDAVLSSLLIDEQSFAGLKTDVGTKVYRIIETVIMPEVKKEFDERKSVYSNNYVEVINGYLDLRESKLDILVNKITPDYGCNFESCAHRIVSVSLPNELKLSQIGHMEFTISVHQKMWSSDNNREYEFYADLISKKSLEEAKILLSESATVLEENKETLLQDEKP